MSFRRILLTEILKLKRTLALLGVFLVPVVLVGLNFLVFYFRQERFASMETNPWPILFRNVFNLNALLVIPVAVMTLAYLLQLTETKAGAWKHLFVLPVAKSAYYLSKLVTLFGLVTLYVVLLGVCVFAAGGVLAWVAPEIGFQEYVYADIIWMGLAKMLLASMGIVGIQHFLSFLWPDLIRSIGAGMILLIAAWVLSSWEHAYLIPYAEPVITINDVSLEDFSFLKKNLGVSLFALILSVFGGLYVVSRRDLS